MPVAAIDFLHGIKNSTNFISQFSSQENSPMLETFLARGAGQVHNQFVAAMAVKAEKRFTTPQLKTILDMCGVGLADLSANDTLLFFKSGAANGNRQSSSSEVHKQFTAHHALMEIQSITASHRRVAEARARIICAYDGTNSPLSYDGTAALDGTPTAAENYVVGECYLNGSQIPAIQDLTIDFGRTVLQLGSDGELYDTFNCEAQQEPTITITTLDTDQWGITGLNGLAITSFSLYLRKMAPGGSRVADGTAEHIKFAGTAGLAYIESTNGDGISPNLTTITLKPVAASATAASITLTSTAVAITT